MPDQPTPEASARDKILADRVRDLAWQLVNAVPPVQPGPVYWLESYAGESYCRKHAIEARAEEFGLGIPLDRPYYRRTALEDAFWDGIFRSVDNESDTTEICSDCGETLSYVLTDYGFQEELDHWIRHPSETTTPEDSYALDRLAMNVGYWTKRRDLLDCLIVLKRALRTVPQSSGEAA